MSATAIVPSDAIFNSQSSEHQTCDGATQNWCKAGERPIRHRQMCREGKRGRARGEVETKCGVLVGCVCLHLSISDYLSAERITGLWPRAQRFKILETKKNRFVVTFSEVRESKASDWSERLHASAAISVRWMRGWSTRPNTA